MSPLPHRPTRCLAGPHDGAPMRPSIAQRLRRTLVTALLLAPLWAPATPVETGGSLPTLVLNDQHDKPVAVTPATRQLVFAADKPASDLASSVLAAQAPGVLGRHGIVYVADISAMPALVTRMFALPRLRELPFAIGLAREAAALAHLPRQGGRVTVLDLHEGAVTQIRYAGDAQALQQALGFTAP